MQHGVTSATRYPQSMALMEELRTIYGSYNKASKGLGIPWATLAMVTSNRKPLPVAAAVKIAEKLALDPLVTIARVEAEHTKGWIQDVWLRIARQG